MTFAYPSTHTSWSWNGSGRDAGGLQKRDDALLKCRTAAADLFLGSLIDSRFPPSLSLYGIELHSYISSWNAALHHNKRNTSPQKSNKTIYTWGLSIKKKTDTPTLKNTERDSEWDIGFARGESVKEKKKK